MESQQLETPQFEKLSRQLQEMQSLVAVRTQQLIQAEKLASMGLMAAGVAHEIKNPVGFISNNLEVLEEYVQAYQKILLLLPALMTALKDSPQPALKAQIDTLQSLWLTEDLDHINGDINQLLQDSIAGAARIDGIVKQLNGFIRLDDEEKPILCDLNEELNTTLKLIHHELKYDIKAHVDFAQIPKVYVFSCEIHQAFLNLLMNAIHAITGKGDIWVITELRDNRICIRIKDSGCGIQATDLGRIFDPLFTTKSSHEGTGLGLSICRNIVENHQGTLSVESTPGQGSEFTISLPAHNQALDVVSTTTSGYGDGRIH